MLQDGGAAVHGRRETMICAGCAAQLTEPTGPRCGVVQTRNDAATEPPLEAFAKVMLEGRYFVDRPLSRGVRSDVYFGTDLKSADSVVIKVLQTRFCEIPDEVEAFQ